ncbi:aldo/keto reductase [Dokdonia sp. Hel_I_53]|uniref:aldo/keto reductase n=1 Tax=Dokdonia sp. Hel_I_53 TaxID=1566287 RepID=UPI001199DF7B|nr:aldo/keto reductase [Dokdonia sp. Hel_I_53]TVZ52448.1 aryl-alcohol dehydrogenase-like predicted oxidoreductase [Dokdonia sp. Hel_I_53]
MKYTNLPHTDIKVSKICLGSMTWGRQNTEEEGHAQMDFALDKGVNFIDTAEMYSVPFQEKTFGETERIIGTWLQKNNNRDQVILTSKITGPSPTFEPIRDNLGFSKKALDDALHGSLKRLQTDYIDLYQLHWPERNTNFFGQRGYTHNPDEQWKDNIAQILKTLEGYIKAGKIRHIGLSNESPFGVMRFMEEARKGAPKMITVQNPYSLLNRKDEVGLTEVLHRENVGHLPYSPLGFGQLTGKYLNGTPKNSRVDLFPNYNRYHNDNSFEATRRYQQIAKDFNLSLTQMALAFVTDRPFVTSNIIGATSLEQLEENIGSVEIALSDEVLKKIDEVHQAIPNPAP